MATNKEEPLSQPEMPRYLKTNLSVAAAEEDEKLNMDLGALTIRAVVNINKCVQPQNIANLDRLFDVFRCKLFKLSSSNDARLILLFYRRKPVFRHKRWNYLKESGSRIKPRDVTVEC